MDLNKLNLNELKLSLAKADSRCIQFLEETNTKVCSISPPVHRRLQTHTYPPGVTSTGVFGGPPCYGVIALNWFADLLPSRPNSSTPRYT